MSNSSSLFCAAQPLKHPPMHMIICFGRVIISSGKAKGPAIEAASSSDGLSSTAAAAVDRCKLCRTEIESDGCRLTCLNRSCDLKAHPVCLARDFLKGDHDSIIPIEGECPGCGKLVLWGDLIRRFNGAQELVDVSAEVGLEYDSDEGKEVSDLSSVDGDDHDSS